MTLAGDIARFCRLTWDRGLVSAAGGTFSARIGTRTRSSSRRAASRCATRSPTILVPIDLAVRKLAGPEREPSKDARKKRLW